MLTAESIQFSTRLLLEFQRFTEDKHRHWLYVASLLLVIKMYKLVSVSMPGEDEEESQEDKHHSEVEGRQRSLSLAWIRLLVIGWQGSL